jgi:Uma2 family endonuclease
MSTSTPAPASTAPEVEYPDSDGQPMAENTLQFRWIVTLQGGVDALFRHDPDVFVAGDLLWYPVEGDNTTRMAPDAMVVFGRPKGDRGSYRQWVEGGIAPQVVFEVLSPGNRAGEMERKFQFYQRFGVEEYYVYDPDAVELEGWIRVDGTLQPIAQMDGWVSPRLGIRFDLSGDELRVIGPDDRPLATYLEVVEQAEQERQRAEQQRSLAEEQRRLAEQERQRAEQQRSLAEEQRRLAEQEQQRVERLAAQLRALGIEPEG